MNGERNPIAAGYQAGGILGLLLGGFLADTWLWFAVVAFSSALGGTLLGWLANSILTRLNHRQSEI
ncbi:MAG: hypothetical protein ACE5LD_02260 [Candidatus Bipolaricaulia bacterium]